MQRALRGGTRIGLSFGGGGSGPDSICEEGTCTPEHQRGIMRNNLIVGCSDVGVYLNEAADTRVLSNTLYATSGIDVRFEASTALVADNVLDGRIRTRDGGTMDAVGNLEVADLDGMFVDPAALDFTLAGDRRLVDAADMRPEVTDDFCGAARGTTPDAGAVEYVRDAPCDTQVPHAARDTGDPDADYPDDTDDDAAPGCGCGGGAPPAPGVFLLALLGLRRRAGIRARYPAQPPRGSGPCQVRHFPPPGGAIWPRVARGWR